MIGRDPRDYFEPSSRSFSWEWLVSCALGGVAFGFALALAVMLATQ